MIIKLQRPVCLDENACAAEIALTTEEIRRVEETAPVGATAGPRYPEGAMRGVNV